MSGDPNQTSTKLRNKAVEIVIINKRPMSAHEIENWIKENDSDLAYLIDSKCSDYVRIILSVTKDKSLVKYKSLKPIQGVDKRSTFYGLKDGQYSPLEWATIKDKVRKTRGKYYFSEKYVTSHVNVHKKSPICIKPTTEPHKEDKNNGENFSFEKFFDTFSFISECDTSYMEDFCY